MLVTTPIHPATSPAPAQDISERSLLRSVTWLANSLLLILWLALGIWAYHYQADAIQTTHERLEREQRFVAENIDGILRQSQAFLNGASLWISRRPQSDPRKDPLFFDYVQSFQRTTHQSMLVRLADHDGTLHLIDAQGNAKKANIADRDYFRGAMKLAPGELFVSRPFQGRATGKWAIAIATRLPENAQDVALAFVAIELSVFEHAFDNAALSKGNSVSLIRDDGVLLAKRGAPPAELGSDLARTPLFVDGLARAQRGIIETMLPQLGAHKHLLAYGRMPERPLIAVVGLNIDQVYAPIWRNIAITALLLALTSAAVWLLRAKTATLVGQIAHNRHLLEGMANHDQLTGALNRRRFIEACAEAIKLSDRYYYPLSLLILDLDHFKSVNDTYGHPAGDQVLKLFARVCQSELRAVDYLGRLGGEEFAVLLPNTDQEGARQVAERIRERVERTRHAFPDREIAVTVSIGGSTRTGEMPFDELYAATDAALYRAKQLGRNQVRWANVAPEPATASPPGKAAQSRIIAASSPSGMATIAEI